MVTTGNICSIDRDLELAAATYQEGKSRAAAALESWDLQMHSILSP